MLKLSLCLLVALSANAEPKKDCNDSLVKNKHINISITRKAKLQDTIIERDIVVRCGDQTINQAAKEKDEKSEKAIPQEKYPILRLIFEILKEMKWFILALFALIAYRSSLLGLISRIQSFESGNNKLKFDNEISKIAKNSIDSKPEYRWTKNDDDILMQGSDARGVILVGWLRIESEIEKILNENDPIKTNRMYGPLQLIQELRKFRVVSDSTYEIIKELGNLRNQAAHARDIDTSQDSIITYLKLVNIVIQAIRTSEIKK